MGVNGWPDDPADDDYVGTTTADILTNMQLCQQLDNLKSTVQYLGRRVTLLEAEVRVLQAASTEPRHMEEHPIFGWFAPISTDPRLWDGFDIHRLQANVGYGLASLRDTFVGNATWWQT